MGRHYAIYDVFTDTPLSGNPLAVVFETEGLSLTAMQRIARQFNLSETVFVLPPEVPNHTARLRIFTPQHEMPFAGHPTVGAALAIAELRHGGRSVDLDVVEMLEENIGPIRCAVRLSRSEAGFCEFDLPRLSREHPVAVDRGAVAAALGVNPHEIGFENHKIGCWSAGVPYLTIPVKDIAAAGRARCEAGLWEKLAPIADGQLASAYVYTRGGQNHTAAYHARMFAPAGGLIEDPATGSAVAALSGAILHFDALMDGHHARIVEQGVEMGRPSLIHLHLDVAGGVASRVRIGGHAVKVAEGHIHV